MKIQFKKSYSSLMAAVVLASGLFTASCNKDSDVAPLEFNQAKANIKVTIQGKWGNPSKPNEWPKVYVNLKSPLYDGSKDNAQVVFENRVNGNISPNGNYKLCYVKKDINTVSKADWNLQEASVSTVGYKYGETVKGWYEYDVATHGNVALENVTVLVGTAEEGAKFAVRLLSFSEIEQSGTVPGPNGNLRVKGNVNIEFKPL
ncbi:MAG: hypothetical protein ACI35Z_01165 [Sphingobacterium hotanense]